MCAKASLEEISAKSLMQIPPHVIGLDLALQLSIYQIDTRARTCPILIAKRPRLEHNVLQTICDGEE